MLVVKVEIWPMGDEGRAREIDRFYVWNTGLADDGESHCYEVGVTRGEPATSKPIKHKRELGALRLIARVLEVWRPWRNG